MSSGTADEAADRALTAVTRKLDRTLSTEYTVNDLIAEATDPANLACMFIGGRQEPCLNDVDVDNVMFLTHAQVGAHISRKSVVTPFETPRPSSCQYCIASRNQSAPDLLS